MSGGQAGAKTFRYDMEDVPNPDSRKYEEVFWLTGTGMPKHLKAQSKEKEWSSSQFNLPGVTQGMLPRKVQEGERRFSGLQWAGESGIGDLEALVEVEL